MLLAIKGQKTFFDTDYKVHQRLVRIDWLQIDFSPQRHAFTHFFFMRFFCLTTTRNTITFIARKCFSVLSDVTWCGRSRQIFLQDFFTISLHVFSPSPGQKQNKVQLNVCQKLLFLHQLTHNMTTDCSRNCHEN